MVSYRAKLVIGSSNVYTENANKPHGYGLIDPNNFSPYPKNPTIVKFFKELGLVDELGSGVRNIHKYGKTYFGHKPQIFEENIFKTIFEFIDNNLNKNERINERINEPMNRELDQNEKLIVSYILQKDTIFNKEAQIITKLSSSQVRILV